MNVSNLFAGTFGQTFEDEDQYYENLLNEEGVSYQIFRQYILLGLLTCIYGLVMGGYHGIPQALSAGIKVPLLFTLVLIVCFPAFYVVQYALGSRLNLSRMLSIILSGFVLTAVIMVSFAPIIIFFLLTGENYHFLQLLHVAVFLFSGIFGMRRIITALQYSCEKKNIYPRIGVAVFRVWIVIFVFVGIQLAWNLRPFLGDKDLPFKFFRQSEGNFYTAMLYSMSQLVSSEGKKSEKGRRLNKPIHDSLIFPPGEEK